MKAWLSAAFCDGPGPRDHDALPLGKGYLLLVSPQHCDPRGIVSLAVRALLVSGTFVTLFDPSEAYARDTFSAPTGDLGANLSPTAERSRMHAELSYFTMSDRFTATGLGASESTTHLLTLTMGAGIRLNRHFELTLGLATEGYALSSSDHSFSVGNVALGGSYVTALGRAGRLKVSGELAFGGWNDNSFAASVQIAAGTNIHGFQDPWYYMPGQLHFAFPARFEFDALKELVITLDVQPDLAIGVNSNPSGIVLISAPGLAYWPSESLMFGARVPMQFYSLYYQATQVALEPFIRYNFGEAVFVATRFTLNLDGPFGFSFDSTDSSRPPRTWGWHLAFGGSF